MYKSIETHAGTARGSIRLGLIQIAALHVMSVQKDKATVLM